MLLDLCRRMELYQFNCKHLEYSMRMVWFDARENYKAIMLLGSVIIA